MHFANLLYSSYWINQPDPVVGGTKIIWFVLLIGLIVGGSLALSLGRHWSDRALVLFLRRLGNCLVWLGIVGLLFFVLRQAHVLFLGWRIWFLFWVIVGGVWFGRLIYFWFKRVPAIRLEQRERQAREEFLPKRK